MASLAHRLGPFAVYSNIFLVMLGLGVLAPMLSDIQSDLDASYGAIAWATGAFAIARLITDYPAGAASLRFPRALVLLLGSAAVCAGCLVAAAAESTLVFAMGRAISGVGSAITTTVGLTVVLDAAPEDARGRASAMYHSALGAGAFFGPGFGGLVATLGGWRLAMTGAGLAAAVSCLLLLLVYRANALPQQERAEEPLAPEPMATWMLAMLRVAAPAYLATFAIFYVRGAAQFTLIPLAGRDVVGMSALALSVVLMSSAALSTVLGPWVGAFSDRVGRTKLVVGGLIALAVGAVAATGASVLWLFLVGIGVISFASTTFSLPSSMIVDRVEPRRRGQAIGLYRVVGDAALSLGPAVTGLLVDRVGFGGSGLSVALVVALALGLWVPLSRSSGRRLQAPAGVPGA